MKIPDPINYASEKLANLSMWMQDRSTPQPQSLRPPLPDDQTKSIREAASPSSIPGWNTTGYGSLNQVYTWGHANSPWNALRTGESLEGYPITANTRSFFGKIDGKDSPLTQITMRLGDSSILQYPNREIPRTEGNDALGSDTIDICVTVPGSGFPGVDINEKIRINQHPNEIEIGKAHDLKKASRGTLESSVVRIEKNFGKPGEFKHLRRQTGSDVDDAEKSATNPRAQKLDASDFGNTFSFDHQNPDSCLQCFAEHEEEVTRLLEKACVENKDVYDALKKISEDKFGRKTGFYNHTKIHQMDMDHNSGIDITPEPGARYEMGLLDGSVNLFYPDDTEEAVEFLQAAILDIAKTRPNSSQQIIPSSMVKASKRIESWKQHPEFPESKQALSESSDTAGKIYDSSEETNSQATISLINRDPLLNKEWEAQKRKWENESQDYPIDISYKDQQGLTIENLTLHNKVEVSAEPTRLPQRSSAAAEDSGKKRPSTPSREALPAPKGQLKSEKGR